MSYEEKHFKTFREAYRIRNKGIKEGIKIVHTTSHKINYKIFYDGVFIVDPEYLLGHYRLTYHDGRIANLPVKYGQNITCKYYDSNYKDSGLREVSYSTMPVKYRDGFAYETIYENPYPQGSIKSIEFVPVKGKENVSVELLHFSVDFSRKEVMHTVEATGEEFAWDGGMEL
jgi:hexosaminidase